MKPASEERLESLIALIAKELSYLRREIHEDLEINLKRRILPEETIDFFNAFFETYGIKVGDFDFDRYFYYPLGFIEKIMLRLRGEDMRTLPVRQEIRPLTVAMLLRAIEMGEWKTEEIEKISAKL